jgi:peptidyl-prolyl cis-trans isomerase C
MNETDFAQGILRTTLLLAALYLPAPALGEQVLATIGTIGITDAQLAQAMASTPYAAQFPAMDEDRQAALRGEMLLRLVDAEILRQEALALGLDQEPDFQREIVDYRTGLLYHNYIQSLRDSIAIPDAVDRNLKQRYTGNPDALAAARSTYVSKRFRALKEKRLKELGKHYHVRVHADRLAAHPQGDVVLAEGDFFTVNYADIRLSPRSPESRRQDEHRLQDIVETRLAAQAALDSGIDVTQQVDSYRKELLPHALMEKKEREWIPDETVLRDYYQAHPEIGYIPARRHVGQLVLATRAEAETARERILSGESLFVLASELSVDPVGRAQAGDMGWLNEGSGFPALEEALKSLKEGEVSQIVETPRGFHLVTVLDQRPGQQRSLADIRDRVRQAIISGQLPAYLKRLAGKHPVKWALPVQETPADAPADNTSMILDAGNKPP